MGGAADRMSPKAKPEIDPAPDAPPLSTSLSQLLIAFTIEFDNEFERRMPHRTTSFGSTAGSGGPWLGSMVLWANAMRLLPEEGTTVAELERRARTDKLQLPGLERWGHIVVTPNPTITRPNPPKRDWLVRPTVMGHLAREVWRPLAGIVEERWRERFGRDEIDALRSSLGSILGRIDLALPEYLPILGYGLFAQILVEDTPTPEVHDEEALASMTLSALLSKVLLAFTIEFEFAWKISLPVSANCLRILGAKPTRISDLARLTGIAKEGVAFATGWLARNSYAEIEADVAGKGKVIRLTAKGQKAREECSLRHALVERQWRERFGDREIGALRESVLALFHKRDGERPLLAEGLMPYPNGWRARKPYVTQTLAFIEDPAGSLPHHPMVLHRGGYPDGS
jgi:DNA-binding MarR family transcriptional regulator